MIKNNKSYNESVNSRKETAVYKDQAIKEFQGNPFIEALPSTGMIGSKLKKIKYTPIITETERAQDIIGRAASIRKIENLSCALSNYLGLGLIIDGMIRNSYSFRNPLSPESVREIVELAQQSNESKSIVIFNDLFSRTSTTDNMITLIGGSGVGKSQCIKEIFSLYPQVIFHNEYKGVYMDTKSQVVYMKFDAPKDGSVRSLCENFFTELDGILESGTFYYDMYANSNRSENSILNNMALQCRNIGLGVLIIDEIQYLTINKANSRLFINFFTEFANKIHIPVILIGNRDAEDLFKVLRDVRRVGSGAEFQWLPMEKDDPDWNKITNVLWDLQVLRDKGELTDSINSNLYEESQGIIGVLVKVFIFAQLYALVNKKETLDSQLISDAVKIYMPRLKNMLTNYKNGNANVIKEIGSLALEELHEDANNKMIFDLSKINNEIKENKEHEALTDKENKNLVREITKMIINSRVSIPIGYSVEQLEALIKDTLESNKNVSKDMAFVLTVAKLTDQKTTKRKSDKKEKKVNDIISADGDGDFSQTLEDLGVTSRYEEFGEKK